jgi:hypothetical protein
MVKYGLKITNLDFFIFVYSKVPCYWEWARSRNVTVWLGLNSLATLDADLKRLRIDVVTIQRSWPTAVFSWRLWRRRAVTCLVTWKCLKSRLIMIFKRWTLSSCATSCWRHPAACIPIALLRHFQWFVDAFPFEFSAAFEWFSCAHVLEMTPLWKFAFKLHAINRNQLFSKTSKMLTDDVMWHISWWSLMYCFLCV